MHNGEKIDIGHTYAGMRSDLNRRYYTIHAVTFNLGLWFMRKASTRWGDYYQVVGSWGNTAYAPRDQLIGDDIGMDMAEILNNDKNVKLSDAFEKYFNSNSSN